MQRPLLIRVQGPLLTCGRRSIHFPTRPTKTARRLRPFPVHGIRPSIMRLARNAGPGHSQNHSRPPPHRDRRPLIDLLHSTARRGRRGNTRVRTRAPSARHPTRG
ncbi:hypothetical protein ACFOY2_27045 [Nonomuraea purpurea]|uniref:Uncharacterized protein n=1 Tax=Nonomuraea purpurea TaxID=1849276 RepID=A0ABV8GDP0_9ACTN